MLALLRANVESIPAQKSMYLLTPRQLNALSDGGVTVHIEDVVITWIIWGDELCAKERQRVDKAMVRYVPVPSVKRQMVLYGCLYYGRWDAIYRMGK